MISMLHYIGLFIYNCGIKKKMLGLVLLLLFNQFEVVMRGFLFTTTIFVIAATKYATAQIALKARSNAGNSSIPLL